MRKSITFLRPTRKMPSEAQSHRYLKVISALKKELNNIGKDLNYTNFIQLYVY